MNVAEFIEHKKRQSHLFILGAGATVATIPNGDRNGKKSPVMDGFLNKIGRTDLLEGIKLETKNNNIEDIYSELHDKPEYEEKVHEIEKAIKDYFKDLLLPDIPTLYDYLILSLRSKDCIATFNWDPLLIQAYNRVNRITHDLPEMLFLHGCVAVGLCKDCHRYTPIQNIICPECGKPLSRPKLMFPVRNKNYNDDIYIKHAWQRLEYYLKTAGLLTIWGYGAPESDTKAKKMMEKAFSTTPKFLDSIEIIDIADKDKLIDRWQEFSKETNFHINIHKSLLDSYLAEFPRRSIEGYVKRNLEGWWGSSKLRLKDCKTFQELRELYNPLIIKENHDDYSVIC